MYKSFGWIALVALMVSATACGSDPIESPDIDTESPDAGDDIGTDAGDPPDVDQDADNGPFPRLVAPSSLSLSAALEASASTIFVVQNIGDADLELHLEPQHDWLSLSDASLTLGPSEQADLTLSASCRDRNEVRSGDLLLSSNDPRAASLQLPITLECGDIDAPALLTVVIRGLPDALDADVVMSGPEGFAEVLTRSRNFDDLTPGTYVLRAAEVGAQTRYAPQTERVEIEALAGRERSADITYAAVPGSLSVTVAGLPTGTSAPLDLVDATGELTRLPANATLDALAPGDYTLEPGDVVLGDSIFSAPSQTFSVQSAQRTDLHVAYTEGRGELTLEVMGLSGASPSLSVTGPEGFSASLNAAQTLRALTPGRYTVVAHDVSVGPARFEGETRTITVQSAQSAELTLVYELVPGQLQIEATGLPAGRTYAAHISGPGFDQSLNGDRTLSDLIPGDYAVIFQDVSGAPYFRALPSQVDLTVTSDGPTALASAHYESVTASLELAIDAPQNASMTIELRSGAQLMESFSITGPSTRNLTLSPGTYTIALNDAPTDAYGNPLTLLGASGPFTLEVDETLTIELVASSPAIVTTGNNAGPGSLRQAVLTVNPGTVITFAPHVSEVLLSGNPIEIRNDLTIRGPNRPEDLVIRAGLATKHFLLALDVEASIEQLTLRDGRAARGGAIESRGILRLRSVDLLNNRATEHGGAIYQVEGELHASLLRATGNEADVDGGALALFTQHARIEDALFDDNSAGGFGGAIHLSANAFTNVGLRIRRALLSDNSAAQGGAINIWGPALLENLTLVDNSASVRGGAITINQSSQSAGQDVGIFHITATGNTAPAASAIWKHQASRVRISGSLVAQNPGDGIAPAYISPYQPITQSGTNILQTPGAYLYSSNIGLTVVNASYDPLLLPLTDNGGFTPTREVLPDSDAFEAVHATLCWGGFATTMTSDQRLAPRPVNSRCTLGAWEQGDAPGGSGLETFDNTGLTTSYRSGSFQGRTGILFTYTDARNEDAFPISGAGVLLRTGTGALEATIPAADTLSVQYRKAYTGSANRVFEVYINGQLAQTSPTFGGFTGEDTNIGTLTLNNLGLTTPFTLEIRNVGAQITLDNLSWD